MHNPVVLPGNGIIPKSGPQISAPADNSLARNCLADLNTGKKLPDSAEFGHLAIYKNIILKERIVLTTKLLTFKSVCICNSTPNLYSTSHT